MREREPHLPRMHDFAVDLSKTVPHPGVDVRLRVAETSEPYDHSDHHDGVIPLAHRHGLRHVFQGTPYFWAPQQWGGRRCRDLGDTSAWYYADDKVIVIGHLTLHDRYQSEPPWQDALLGTLWNTWESWLQAQCPEARRIATPGTGNLAPAEPDVWQEFLAMQGYTPFFQQAFAKAPGTVSIYRPSSTA